MAFVDVNTKHLLYPGWHSGPVAKMLKDGLNYVRGVLISVNPITDVKQYNTVDTGHLLMRGAGCNVPQYLLDSFAESDELAKAVAKTVQNAMKFTEDIPLLAVKACGLFPYLWAVTSENVPVTLLGLLSFNSSVHVTNEQPGVVVGDMVLSGVDAFGTNLDADLKHLEKILI